MNTAPVDRWLLEPLKRFMNNSAMSGIVLFSSALLALILSNSPWADEFHHFWEIKFGIGFGEFSVNKSLHHWINDGLMAVFFFVVGLELKREIIDGELSSPRKALLPIAAAVGGMVFPALIYLLFNLNITGGVTKGWGVPMATDIAFALGVLYLLGKRVPLSLKVFLTALAIVDDIGAVLVIAFFYTSEINFLSLYTGACFLAVLIISNSLGVRSTLWYGIIGIGGLWLAFLMSGVHATIAAVLAAFAIPANVKISEKEYSKELSGLMAAFQASQTNQSTLVTKEQLHVLDEIETLTRNALTPLQRLEHLMHPLVAFIVMPVFALANAGVELSGNVLEHFGSPVTLGILLGLLLGKVVGVYGVSMVFIKLKWADLPQGMNTRHILGASFLAAIGFTMSLFITSLAFNTEDLIIQAKVGILSASFIATIAGYWIIRLGQRP